MCHGLRDSNKHDQYRGQVCHVCSFVMGKSKICSRNRITDKVKNAYEQKLGCAINTNDWAPTVICSSCNIKLLKPTKESHRINKFVKWQDYSLLPTVDCPFERHFANPTADTSKKYNKPLTEHPAVKFVDAPQYELEPKDKHETRKDPSFKEEDEAEVEEIKMDDDDEDWVPDKPLHPPRELREFTPYTQAQIDDLFHKLKLSQRKSKVLLTFLRSTNALDRRCRVGRIIQTIKAEYQEKIKSESKKPKKELAKSKKPNNESTNNGSSREDSIASSFILDNPPVPSSSHNPGVGSSSTPTTQNILPTASQPNNSHASVQSASSYIVGGFPTQIQIPSQYPLGLVQPGDNNFMEYIANYPDVHYDLQQQQQQQNM